MAGNFTATATAASLQDMSEDHEFKVHHLVGELVPLFRVQDASGVDSLVELLLKHRKPYVTTQVPRSRSLVGIDVMVHSVDLQVSAATAKKKIAEFSSKGDQFRRKYDELHQQQVSPVPHWSMYTTLD